MKTIKNQHGFSLIEVMVSMIIGLLLSIAITNLYFNSQKASLSRSQYAELEDNGRLALDILTRTIKHTGYSSANASPLAGEDRFIIAAVVDTNCGGINNVLNDTLFGKTADNKAVSTNSDSIGVIFVGDAELNRDCSGEQLPVACYSGGVGSIDSTKIYSYFSVSTNTLGNPILNCTGSRSNQPVEIAEGVENLQVLYGIDSNADNQVNRYVNVDDIISWDSVISVQLAILVRSLHEVKSKSESKSYRLLDNNMITTSDKYQRAVFSTIIRLRNVQS
ncbi:MAG: PilW family protein [Cocleimonas sp.]|nr:PilW family protein [Cocleimonas sp.]